MSKLSKVAEVNKARLFFLLELIKGRNNGLNNKVCLVNQLIMKGGSYVDCVECCKRYSDLCGVCRFETFNTEYGSDIFEVLK